MTITFDLRLQALSVAGALEPEVMSGEQAVQAVEDLAIVERAVANTLLFCALRVATSQAWKGHGHATAADWLAARLGISVREAAAHLRTAANADKLPKTKDAMKKGDLSPDQAGAVSSGATADSEAEDDLLASAANDTNKALKDKAAKAKAAATDGAERERRIRARRSLRHGTDADGAFWARIYGPGVDAAAFTALLRPFEELLFRHGRAAGTRDSHENRSYDAFFAMLAFFEQRSTGGTAPAATDGPAPASNTGDAPAPTGRPGAPSDRETCSKTDETAAPGDDDHVHPATALPDTGGPGARGSSAPAPAPAAVPVAGSPPTWSPPWDPDRAVPLPPRLPGGNNVKVIVLVDHTALLRGHTVAGETCEIAGVGPISVQAAHEILRNDPFLAVVVRKGRDVVNVAHHGRGLNAHQRTAVEAVGLRCSNQACNRTVAIQVDHRVGYVVNQETKLDNQDPLCPNCHRLKTHHGHHLEPGTGPRAFLPPSAPGDLSTESGRTTGPLTDDEADEIQARLLRRYPEAQADRQPALL